MIPLYLVTGFFGSGKTTLINHVLSDNGIERRVAVLINDFGDVNVDSEVISSERASGLDVYGVTGGSIFCSCRHWEFIAGLHALANHEPDLIIVEVSGMADPSPVVTDIRIASDMDAGHSYSNAGTVCLIDASMFASQVDMFPVVRRQVKHATIVVVNKIDLLEQPVESKRDAIVAAVKAINRDAHIELTTNSSIPIDLLFLNPPESLLAAPPDRSLNEPGNQPGKLVLTSARAMHRDQIFHFYDQVKHELLRFKGFCLLEDGWSYVDATGDQIQLRSSPVTREKTEIVCIFDRSKDSLPTVLQGLWRDLKG